MPALRPRQYFCLLSTLLSCWAIPTLAQAPPSADTFVSSSTPKLSYRPSITLIVGQGTTSFVQFNLSGIPSSASISKASLRLYVDAVAKNGSFDVYQLNSSWNENTLTYNTPPTGTWRIGYWRTSGFDYDWKLQSSFADRHHCADAALGEWNHPEQWVGPGFDFRLDRKFPI